MGHADSLTGEIILYLLYWGEGARPLYRWAGASAPRYPLQLVLLVLPSVLPTVESIYVFSSLICVADVTCARRYHVAQADVR